MISYDLDKMLYTIPADKHSTEEIRKMIGADSLGYMQIDYLEGMAGGLPLCKACFDGNYPMEIPAEIKQD